MARYVEQPPRNNVYTGILAMSLLVLVVASALLFIDLDSLGKPPPAKLSVNVPGAGGTAPAKAAP